MLDKYIMHKNLKRTISIMLIALMAMGLVACTDITNNNAFDENSTIEEMNNSISHEVLSSEEIDAGEQEAISNSSEGKALVVYFSITGNTKNVAEKIASLTDADIYEIQPAKEYTDADINYGDSNSRTSKEQNDSSVRPEIKSETISIDGYETIYIGYPIWWGEEPRIMDTFVENYDFKNITIIPFCTSGSSSIGNSGNNLAQNAGSGNWLEGKRFDAGVSEDELNDWINELQK